MEQAVQKRRVAVYCRFTAGDGGQPACREAQKICCAQKSNESPDLEMVGFYADQGIRGADRKTRTEFNKMIAACKRGDIDIIITRSASRFARNMAECMETVRMLKSHGVGVIFEREGFNSLTASGNMILFLFNELARIECEAIEQRYPAGLPCRYAPIHVD